MEWIGAMLLLVYTTLTYFTFQSVKESNELTRLALTTAHRPWMTIVNGSMSAATAITFNNNIASSSYSLTISNVGTSPALRFSQAPTLRIDQMRLLPTTPSCTEFSTYDAMTKTLGGIIVPQETLEIPKRDISGIFNPKETLPVAAMLELCFPYSDEFGQMRLTGQRFLLHSEGKPLEFVPTGKPVKGEWKLFPLGTVAR